MIIFFSTLLYSSPCPTVSKESPIIIEKNKTKKNHWFTQAKIAPQSHITITFPTKNSLSAIIRTSDEHPDGGYAATVTKSTLQIHRIENGENIPITNSVSFPTTSKEHTLHILQNHDAMEAILCIQGEIEPHVRLRWEANA